MLFCCLLALLSNIAAAAQESASPAAPQKPAAAADEAGRIQAKERRAALQEKRTEARVEAEKRRAVRAVEAKQKRAGIEKKRVEARAAVEARRAVAASSRMFPPDGTFRLLGSKPGIDRGKVVRGAPYSATAVTEHTQTLGDGNRIIKKNESAYYRDGEGRVRIDQKLKTIGKWNADGDPPSIVTIWDPVAGRYYSLDPRARTAVTNIRKAVPVKVTEAQKATTVVKPSAAPTVVATVVSQSPSGQGRRKESLGNQVIQGVTAEGTRLTRTIPAGEIGNVLPIDIVDETWYAPDLQVKVMTRHYDPRSGETVYRLTNINRSEPARSLFEVPADYRVIDRSAPRPARKADLPALPGTAPTPQKTPEMPRLVTAPASPKNL